MLSEELEFLKIKPLPKKNEERQFFIEKKREEQLPSIINKTSENLINPLEFISKIQEKTGLINKDKIAKTILDYKVEEQKQESKKLDEQSKIINNIIEEIIKTTDTIIIKQFSTSKQKIIDDFSTKIVKKTDYIKEYNLDHKIELDKKLGTTTYKDRLPEIPEKIIIKADNYYLNNRENFIEFIDRLFFKYKSELLKEEQDMKDGKITISCDTYSKKSDFSLLTHQKIVRDYINIYTPFRGLLLYHGLGSGKTCSAITVAEETRIYNKYNNIDNDIIIVCSPLVQKNFRLQLFDENKLEYKNNKWFINNCAGNNFLEEINLMNIKLSRKKVISLVDNLIKKTYKFKGYIEFANLISSVSNVDNILKTSKLSTKKKNLLIKNKLQKYFDNNLIIIDEIHNIRDSKDNSNKLVAKQFYNLVKNVDNLKLILLSATPMFNDYKEIVFLINILNMNDKRSLIDIKDIFNSDGSFVKSEDGKESGKELLMRKLNGYISYIKGDNPFIFPYRILPELFDKSKSIKYENYTYPTNNIIGNRMDKDSNINIFDIYLTKISNYQEKVYKYIINKLDLSNKDNNFKYTELLKPLESLNIVFPNTIINKIDFDKEDTSKLSVNIDDLVDPRMTTVSTILKHIHKGKIDSVFTLDDGEYEIIEAKVLENSELLNKTLEKSSFPEGIKIGLITRDKKVLVPSKNFEFKLNDTVILLSSRSQLKKVEQLFRISEYY